jgi:ribosome-associated protein
LTREEPVTSEAGQGGERLAPGVTVPEDALRFQFVSSSGPGGQNVNRRATKAELRVHLDAIGLPDDARARLESLAGSRAVASGELIIVSDRFRSQRRNRDDCLDRLRRLVVRALQRPRTRRPTRPTRASVRRRLEEKSRRSDTKKLRRPPET